MVDLGSYSRRAGKGVAPCLRGLEHSVQESCNQAEAVMSFVGNILCAATAWQPTGADRLRKTMRVCAIVCGFLILSFSAVTSSFANEDNDRKINAYFLWMMTQLNVQAIACRDYVSFDTASINQRLMQYQETRYGGSISISTFDEGVKYLHAKLEKLTLAEKQFICREALRDTILNYAQTRDLMLYRKLDKGVPPPSVELESVGLQ